MSSTNIKKQVERFRQEFHLQEVSAEALEDIFEQQGFTVVYFNPILNDPDVETVIKSFELQDMIRQSNGFLYMDQTHRLVFLNENLSDSEKRIVLAHEQGHYYCGHSSHTNIIGRNVFEEFEANEFTHYLLGGSLSGNLKRIVDKNRKRILCLMFMSILLIGSGIALKEHRERRIYEGEYYVTRHGTKYHLKGCVTIEGHKVRRLTKEDVEAGKYEPCNVCQPMNQ